MPSISKALQSNHQFHAFLALQDVLGHFMIFLMDMNGPSIFSLFNEPFLSSSDILIPHIEYNVASDHILVIYKINDARH